MMKLWAVVLVMSFGGLCARASKFNAEEHDALCNVLVAAVELWEIEESPESELPSALKTAINQAIFGKEKGGHLEDLNETLPDVYEHPGDREEWCGKCGSWDHTDPYPGKSIPHDLMCLCTPGKHGVPFYTPSDSSWLWVWRRNTLCGKREWELGAEKYEVWYSLPRGSAMWDLRKPWNSVILGCLKGAARTTDATKKTVGEKLIMLNDTLHFFKTKLVDDGYGKPKLGGHPDDREESNGLSAANLNVRYGSCGTLFNGGPKKKPWWKKLSDALHDQKFIHTLVKTDDWFSWWWRRHSKNSGKFH